LGYRAGGGALLGLQWPQILLLAGGITALVVLPAATHGIPGAIAAAVLAVCCALAAFTQVDGQPLYGWVVVLVPFIIRRVSGQTRWTAPLPLITGTPSLPAEANRGGFTGLCLAVSEGRSLPRCLTGLELHAVDRPGWAGAERCLSPVGVVRDRRRETLTILMGVRGEGFSLLEPADQHSRLADWGQVLAQFGREVSPVVRLGWTLWSAPASPGTSDGHLEWLHAHRSRHAHLHAVDADYRELLSDTTLIRHELRVWITVAAGRPGGRSGLSTRRGSGGGSHPDPMAAALGAAKALTDRCASAGLVVSAPLSPVQIAEATRAQADPALSRPSQATARGLPERVGLASVLFADEDQDQADASADGGDTPDRPQGVDAVHVAPLAVDARWDAVRVDGAWHRAFWIAGWPQNVTDPRWLETLLMTPPCARSLAVSYEPISPRTSRRKIIAEAVAVDSQLQLRERHDLRVPVGLQRAHGDIDQREAELGSGHCEVGLLGLIVLTETDPERLDAASQALLEQAAHCGITDLRALHARHDAAWACTLPLGRVPDRELLHGFPG
jgi:hypothetical protein